MLVHNSCADCCVVYMNDIWIHSRSIEQHNLWGITGWPDPLTTLSRSKRRACWLPISISQMIGRATAFSKSQGLEPAPPDSNHCFVAVSLTPELLWLGVRTSATAPRPFGTCLAGIRPASKTDSGHTYVLEPHGAFSTLRGHAKQLVLLKHALKTTSESKRTFQGPDDQIALVGQ